MKNVLSIAEYLAMFTELYMCCVFCNNFFQKKKIKYVNIIQLLVMTAVVTFFNLFSKYKFVTQYGSIMITISVIIIIFTLYNTIFIRIIGACVLYACIVVVCDAVSLFSYALFSGRELGKIVQTGTLQRIGAIIISKFLLISIVLVISRRNIKIIVISSKYWIRFLIIANMMLLMAYFLVNRLIQKPDYKDMVVVIIVYYIIMLILIIAMVWILFKIGYQQEQKEQYNMIEVTNETLKKALYDNENTLIQWKKSHHDYKNNLICMKELVRSNNYDKLSSYIDLLIQQSGDILYQYKTGNKIADILFNQKLTIAKSRGILATVNVAFPNDCNVSDTDICAIFGNALDNAIEGCKDCESKQIRIVVKQIKGFLKIKIENTVSKNPLLENPDMHTTKKNKDNHGIGLKSIRQSIEKNGGVMELSYVDNFFILEGIIPLEITTN